MSQQWDGERWTTARRAYQLRSNSKVAFTIGLEMMPRLSGASPDQPGTCATPRQLLEVLISDSELRCFPGLAFPMNMFDMRPPGSWFDRQRKMGKFTAVRA